MAKHLIFSVCDFFKQPKRKQKFIFLSSDLDPLSFTLLLILILGDSYSCYFLSVYYEPGTLYML